MVGVRDPHGGEETVIGRLSQQQALGVPDFASAQLSPWIFSQVVAALLQLMNC